MANGPSAADLVGHVQASMDAQAKLRAAMAQVAAEHANTPPAAPPVKEA